MAAIATATDFIGWGIDQAALGPVERPALVSWVKDERVTAAPWTFAAQNGCWQKAPDLPELQITRAASRKGRRVEANLIKFSTRCAYGIHPA